MTTTVIYGIKNCDTVKKARAWLTQRGIDYRFVDVREDGISQAQVAQWIERLGAETLINKRSTTWKQLDAEQQSAINSPANAAKLILAQPTLIKRPLLETGEHVGTGFKAADYIHIFSS